MEQLIVKIKLIQHITHDVLQITTEKPPHFKFTPGQATEISLNKAGWQNEKRPFTFTCLPDSDFEDIKHEEEFKNILGENFINILSDEKADGYAHGQITEEFLKKHLSEAMENIYICGPPPMMESIEKQLIHLKIDKKQIIKEAF